MDKIDWVYCIDCGQKYVRGMYCPECELKEESQAELDKEDEKIFDDKYKYIKEKKLNIGLIVICFVLLLGIIIMFNLTQKTTPGIIDPKITAVAGEKYCVEFGGRIPRERLTYECNFMSIINPNNPDACEYLIVNNTLNVYYTDKQCLQSGGNCSSKTESINCSRYI